MINKLKEILPNINIEENKEMKDFSTFKLGGKAKYFIEIKDITELKVVLKLLKESNIEYVFIGNGSNTVFRDGIYNGVALKFKEGAFNEVLIDGETVTFGANLLLSEASNILKDNSLSGFEALSGIPGSIGGACFMNAGAYEHSISDLLISCHAVSGEDEKDFSINELNMSYRNSIFMTNNYIVTSATFKLLKGDINDIILKMNEYKERRVSKQPLKYPSCGSAFKRPANTFAGKLIEDSGLKGFRIGGVEVSTLHAGFLINVGNGTATDLVNIIEYIKEKVYKDSGIMLEPEIRII